MYIANLLAQKKNALVKIFWFYLFIYFFLLALYSVACQESADDAVVFARRIEANRKISWWCFFASLIATLMPEKKEKIPRRKSIFPPC